MNKKIGLIKRAFSLLLIFLISINSFAAVVSDNDGSAFITKAEFDSLKNNFQAQIDQYNTSIDSKIDGAIAQYLAGIQITRESERKIEMQDKTKVLSIGTTNAPKYEYSEAMIQSSGGGILIVNADGNTQANRNRMIMSKEIKLYGNSDQWNNPKQKKIAIRNVNSTNAEFVDFYRKCAERITIGFYMSKNIGQNPIYSARTGDFYMTFNKWPGKTQQDKNWDITDDSGIQGYGARLPDPTTGKMDTDDFAYGNMGIASAETKFEDPADFYLNVYKPIPHTCWSNYEYNCSLPGSGTLAYCDTYIQNLALNLQPGKTDHTDGQHIDDTVVVEWNNRWKNATEDGSHQNTITLTTVVYNVPGSEYGWYQAARNIVGGTPYPSISSNANKAGLFCLGWDNRINDWNKLWYAGYDKFVDFYNAKSYTNKANTLQNGKDGKPHLYLAAGFPLLQVNQDETIKYNFKIEETGTYDLFIKRYPFTSASAYSEGGLISAKNLSTGAATSTTISLTGGGVDNIVEFVAPEDGYIWIKWAEHTASTVNLNGKGTLLLEPTATIIEPES